MTQHLGSAPIVSRHEPAWGPTLASAAGLAAPVVFVGTFTIAGAVQPGYDPLAMFVSELVNGPGGWVQRVSFVVTGVLVVVFATRVRAGLGPGRGPTALVVTLGALGLGLLGSGFFDTDPSTTAAPVTTRGLVHGLLGAVVFLAIPLSCLLLASHLRRSRRARALQRWSFLAGLALVVVTVAFKLSELPGSPLLPVKGLVQRVDLIVWFSWLFTLAASMIRRA